MQQRKSKKILIYFFLLLIVGSINNINLNELKFQNVHDINITGLDIKNKLILLKKIENFNLNNIFLINKMDLIDEIESNTLVENYSIFKRYPSSLDINIEKTKFLAKINKNGQIFYIGSNRKFIKNNDQIDNKYNALKVAIITPDKDIIPDAETLNPAYIVFDNYEIILKWNRSLRFALAVCTLKDKFKNEL